MRLVIYSMFTNHLGRGYSLEITYSKQIKISNTFITLPVQQIIIFSHSV